MKRMKDIIKKQITMKYEIEKEKVDEIYENLSELDEFLTERITDLFKVKGFAQSRHAYVFYRSFLWEIRRLMKSNLVLIEQLPILDRCRCEEPNEEPIKVCMNCNGYVE